MRDASRKHSQQIPVAKGNTREDFRAISQVLFIGTLAGAKRKRKDSKRGKQAEGLKEVIIQ